LAKLKDPPLARLQDYIAGHNLFRASLGVSSFTLFSSHLGHGDPLYRAECDYPLIAQNPNPRPLREREGPAKREGEGLRGEGRLS